MCTFGGCRLQPVAGNGAYLSAGMVGTNGGRGAKEGSLEGTVEFEGLVGLGEVVDDGGNGL